MAAFAKMAELSSFDKDLMVCKIKIFTIIPFSEKVLWLQPREIDNSLFGKVTSKLTSFETECYWLPQEKHN